MNDPLKPDVDDDEVVYPGISVEAHDWVILLTAGDGVDPTPEQTLEFFRWLSRSDRHARVFADRFAFDCHLRALAGSPDPQHHDALWAMLEQMGSEFSGLAEEMKSPRLNS